jgi:hypothetical protein
VRQHAPQKKERTKGGTMSLINIEIYIHIYIYVDQVSFS